MRLKREGLEINQGNCRQVDGGSRASRCSRWTGTVSGTTTIYLSIYLSEKANPLKSFFQINSTFVNCDENRVDCRIVALCLRHQFDENKQIASVIKTSSKPASFPKTNQRNSQSATRIKSRNEHQNCKQEGYDQCHVSRRPCLQKDTICPKASAVLGLCRYNDHSLVNLYFR